jgi:hypothetical protein
MHLRAAPLDPLQLNALAAAVSAFEVARIKGTSVTMIERVYGKLIGALALTSQAARRLGR